MPSLGIFTFPSCSSLKEHSRQVPPIQMILSGFPGRSPAQGMGTGRDCRWGDLRSLCLPFWNNGGQASSLHLKQTLSCLDLSKSLQLPQGAAAPHCPAVDAVLSCGPCLFVTPMAPACAGLPAPWRCSARAWSRQPTVQPDFHGWGSAASSAGGERSKCLMLPCGVWSPRVTPKNNGVH